MKRRIRQRKRLRWKKMGFKDFTQFSVWQKGFELVIDIYNLSKEFPSEEKFGITSDMRRAANSVVHNIAEGL